MAVVPAKVIPLWVSLSVSGGLTALSVGLNYLLKPKSKLGDNPKYDRNIVDTETYLPLVYGRAVLPVLPIFMDTDPDNKDILYGVGAICHGEIEDINRIYFNNQETVYKLVGNDYEIIDRYKDLVTFAKRLGTTGQKSYGDINRIFRKWTDNHRGDYVASISMKFRFDIKKFSSIPDLFAQVKGKHVYDLRDGSTGFSTNPVICLYDYLTNSIYGVGVVASEEIDLDSFKTEANFCDELISYTKIDSPKKACNAIIVEQIDTLTNGNSYKYAYTYCSDNGIGGEGETYTLNESDLSLASGSISVTSNYGKMKITAITAGTSSIKFRRIYRQVNGAGSYYLIGTLDDNTQTTFVDTVPDSSVGAAHSTSGTPPTAPVGAPSGTFTDYSGSGLDKNKYYRYKYTYYNQSGGEETSPSPASRRVKTRKGSSVPTAIQLSGIPESDDTYITHKRIYRTEGFTDDTGLVYKLLATITNETSSYLDIIGDGSLGVTVTDPNLTTMSKIARFSCNGMLDTGDDVLTNIEKILSSCRGRLFYQSGRYTVWIPKISVPETFELTEHNIIGDWDFTLAGASEMPNIVKASFINPAKEWKSDTVIWPPTDNENLYLKDDNNFKVIKSLDLPLTINEKIAKTICQVNRKESRNNVRVQVTAKEEAKKLRIGNLVKVTHETPAWSGKPFWVEAVGILPDATVRLALTETTENDYDPETLTEDELPGSDTTYPDPTIPPDEVTDVTITQELFVDQSIAQWRLKVTFTPPDNAFWLRSDVYVKPGTESEYELYTKVNRDSGGVFYIYPIEGYTKYFIKILSVSTSGASLQISDDSVSIYTHTVVPPSASNSSSIEIANRGTNTNVYGSTFRFRWSEQSSHGDGAVDQTVSQRKVKTFDEYLEYYVWITFPNIPDSVKKGGVSINTQPCHGTGKLQRGNEFSYTVDQNIEATKDFFGSLPASSATRKLYYGIPQRTIKIEMRTLNAWNKLSAIKQSLIVTNKAPDMLKRDGVTPIKPTVESTLSGAEIGFSHPPDEYDIVSFLTLIAGDETGGRSYSDVIQAFTAVKYQTETAYAVGEFIFPSDINGHCYKCTIGGTSGAVAPTFTKPSSSTLHPTINDNGVVWTHWCILRQKKVASQSSVDSTNDEIDSTTYEVEFKRLDKKKTFYCAVIPYDAYGAGTSSDISDSFVSGTTEDDTKTSVIEPAQVTGVTIAINSGNNVVIKFNKPSGSDISDVKKAIIDLRSRQGITGTPTLAVRPSGDIPTLGDVSNGYYKEATTTLVVGETKTVKINLDEEQASKIAFIFTSAKTNYTYFARVRFENSSGQTGDWSDWTYNSDAVTSSVTADDLGYQFKKFTVRKSDDTDNAVFSSTGQKTISWTAAKLKFKNSDGTSSTKNIASGSASVTNAGDIKYVIWDNSAPTVFSAITADQLNGNATYKDAVSVAFFQAGSDSTQKAFVVGMSDQKEAVINGSVIAGDSIIASHLQAASVKASKMDIDGTLTMGHSSGAKILFKDSSSVNRIKIAATNGGDPKLVITKSGKDADSSDIDTPENLLFSTETKVGSTVFPTYNFKIIAKGSTSVTWAAGTVNAGTEVGTPKLLSTVANGNRGALGWILFNDGFKTMFRLCPYRFFYNDWVFMRYEIGYDPASGTVDIIRMAKNNHSNNNYNIPEETMVVNWYLLGDTMSS